MLPRATKMSQISAAPDSLPDPEKKPGQEFTLRGSALERDAEGGWRPNSSRALQVLAREHADFLVPGQDDRRVNLPTGSPVRRFALSRVTDTRLHQVIAFRKTFVPAVDRTEDVFAKARAGICQFLLWERRECQMYGATPFPPLVIWNSGPGCITTNV